MVGKTLFHHGNLSGRHVSRRNAGISTFLLALLPLVPMPIAGGVPITLALSLVFIIVALTRGLRIPLPIMLPGFFMLGGILLLMEGLSILVHSSPSDIDYFLGRGLWLFTSLSISLLVAPWIVGGRLDLFEKVMSTGLLLLIGAMLIESTFYPNWSTGRQMGVINIPWPRATGVPNSDGKIGTFLCICLAYYLFHGPITEVRWRRMALKYGPWIGLLFTQSRSTLLALAVIITLYGMASLMRRGRPIITFGWIVLAVLGLVCAASFGGRILEVLVGEGIFKENVMLRFDHYAYGISQIKNDLLFGSGAEYLREYDDTASIHNTVLAMAVKSGIISAALILLILIYPALMAPKLYQTKLLALAIALGFLTEHMLYPGFINEFLVLAVALTLASSYATLRTNLGLLYGQENST